MMCISKKFLIALFVMGLNSVEARPLLDEGSPARTETFSELAIFKDTLFPFMRKNCAECHGEQAFYPVGPTHSHSKPELAFERFSKLLDRNDYINSKFIKVGSNKHFCKEHDFNCDIQDQVTIDLKQLFDVYLTAVTNKPTAVKSNSSWIIKQGQTVKNQSLSVSGKVLELETVVQVYKKDYIKVISISLSGADKIDVAMDGIEIRVNDHLPSKETGFETLKRELSFDGLGKMKTKITSHREVILKANPGDLISIKVLNLREQDLKLKTASCEDQDYADRLVDNFEQLKDSLSQVIYGSIEDLNVRNSQQICSQILLRINADVPSQSFLVQQLAKDQQLIGLQLIQRWLQGKPITAKLDPILITANNMNRTCYATEYDVYCFAFDRVWPFHIKVDQGVDRVVIGYRSVAIEDKKNNWRFTDLSNSRSDVPNVFKQSETYNFGIKVLDLQIGNGITCFLIPQNRLYCGGTAAQKMFNFKDENNFYRLSSNQFEKFDLNNQRILGIGLDQKVYMLGKLANDSRSGGFGDLREGKELQDNKLNFGHQAESIISSFRDFVLRTPEGKLYGYSSESRETNFSGIFGERFSQGKEISEGMDFTDLKVMSEFMCGLDNSKKLFCRGRYPFLNLRNVQNTNSSSVFMKIQNVPSNIKKIISGYNNLCLLLDTDQIVCAGTDGLNGRTTNNTNRDRSGRMVYTGTENVVEKLDAPNLLPPIE
jgi:hypothetical protein